MVPSPAYQGAYSVLMRIRPTDEVNYRSELTSKSARNFDWRNEYWVGFAFRAQNWSGFPGWATFWQAHAVPHADSTGTTDWSCGAGKNTVSITFSRGDTTLQLAVVPRTLTGITTGGAIATTVWREKLRMNHWYAWVLRLKPSPDSNGVIEAWRDGEKIYSQFGGNVNILDDCGKPTSERHYMKIGLYRDKKDSLMTHELAYDNVRVFKGEDGYAIVDPAQPASIRSITTAAQAGLSLKTAGFSGQLRFSRPVTSAEIMITDILGRRVLHKRSFSGDRLSWNTDVSPAGVYVITALEKGKTIRTRACLVK